MPDTADTTIDTSLFQTESFVCLMSLLLDEMDLACRSF